MRSAMWEQWLQIERGPLVQRCIFMYLGCTERERLIQVRPAKLLRQESHAWIEGDESLELIQNLLKKSWL